MAGGVRGQLAEASRVSQLLRRVLLSLAPPLLLALPLLLLVAGSLEGRAGGRHLVGGAGADAATSRITASAAVRFLASPAASAGEVQATPEAEPNFSMSRGCNETGLNATDAMNCSNATDASNFTGCNGTNATDAWNFTGCDSKNATNGSNGTHSNGTAPPPPPPLPNHVPWIKGTWTTGYWDCCKPSCSWPRKGKVDRPTFACSAATGERLSNSNERSVCDGGLAASCSNHQPFLANKNLAFGFAAAAVSGNHGLMGDDNCGQCFELKFVKRMHGGNIWGGAHPQLVNKSMVVQVTNIGYDVTGSHSFDLQIPGAGQGIFTGCSRQYQGFGTGDFDCDSRYGGCSREGGCARLPWELQAGCHWRYRWFHWLEERGQTNNPWVHFRRVRCPKELVAISGSTPDDDDVFRPVVPEEYV